MDSSEEAKESLEVRAVQDEADPSEVSTEGNGAEICATQQEEQIQQEEESKNENLPTTCKERENDDDNSQNTQASSDTQKEESGEDKNIKEGNSMSQSVDQSNLHYEGELCVYTDPETKYQYLWNDDKQEWVERNSVDPNYTFDGQTYIYTDSNTKITYQWDKDKNSWEKNNNSDGDGKSDAAKSECKQNLPRGEYGYEGDTHTYTDSSDGTVYFWDKEKNAWFPKVDDDFLAQYQMNYGFVDNSDKEEKEITQEKPQTIEVGVKRKAPEPPAWFDVGEESTKVYVSNLPLDITESEFVDVMQKCGLVMKDIDTGKMKVKLYMEPGTNQLKGDALCTYIKSSPDDPAHMIELVQRFHHITVCNVRYIITAQIFRII